jgi:hypothetical protein
MNIEALWYETAPYAYLVVGLVAVLFSRSVIGLAFSIALIAAAVVIFSLRRVYRSPARQILRKYSRRGT